MMHDLLNRMWEIYQGARFIFLNREVIYSIKMTFLAFFQLWHTCFKWRKKGVRQIWGITFWNKNESMLKYLWKKVSYAQSQRCQLLRITRIHYGKLQKFSVFCGLRKTRIFLREFFKKVVIRNVAKKSLNKRI